MVSSLHELLVDLCRERPEVATELMGRVTDVPEHDEVRTDDPDAGELAPVPWRADLVLLLERTTRKAGKRVVHGVILEVQLCEDTDKRFSWPVYVPVLRARHRCPVTLLVLAIDDEVATWARQSIPTGHPAYDLVPLVLTRQMVPWVSDLAQARRTPELAVLSAICHGNELPEGLRVVTTALETVRELAGDRATVYVDVIVQALSGRWPKARPRARPRPCSRSWAPGASSWERRNANVS